MNIKFSTALYLAFSASVLAQEPAEKTYMFELAEPDESVVLEVDVRLGSVTIIGSERKNVEVTTRTRLLSREELEQVGKNKYWNGWKEENETSKEERSREGLKLVTNAVLSIEIEQRGNKIEIDSEESTYFVDLIVNVPRNTRIEADTYRGDGISVSNISGYLELETWRGDISASNIDGPLVAETHQSAIEVSFASFSNVSPSSLTTHSGDIDITVADNMSAKINVQNYRGEILSGLDAEFVPTDDVQRSNSGDKTEVKIGGFLTATLNDGGQNLILTTYSGDVYVRKP